jgi:hypothetical protein
MNFIKERRLTSWAVVLCFVDIRHVILGNLSPNSQKAALPNILLFREQIKLLMHIKILFVCAGAGRLRLRFIPQASKTPGIINRMPQQPQANRFQILK